jgi:acyl-CoA-binding protein
VVFDLTEKEKMKLYGLYQQATKGDYAKNTVQGLLSIFSGPNNLEKVAWQKQNGTPREEAMHNWVYDVKKLIDPLYLDKLNARCVVDARLKEKPTIKSLKVFYSYLDHFVVIHREYRHFTRSQITETLQSVESAYNEDGEDNTPLF